MRLSVDSSSLAKRYVQEYGSEEIDSLLQHASELALCIILVPEIISALNRRQRERVLTVADYRQAKRRLLDDVRDATVLQITPAVISHSLIMLEKMYCELWMLFMLLAPWSGKQIYLPRLTANN